MPCTNTLSIYSLPPPPTHRLDSSTQYGLLEDVGPGAQQIGRGRRADDFSGAASLLDDTRPAATAPRGKPPRPPGSAAPVGFDPYGLASEEVGGLPPGGDVRTSLLPERPTEMRRLGGGVGAGGGGGGGQAEVLSFLDEGSGGLGKSGSSTGSRSGGLGGLGALAGGSGGGGGGFNPYGDEDVPNAGSAAPSRPMTAATLMRDSSDMPRLASPALESLLPGAGAGGGGGGLGGGLGGGGSAAGGGRVGVRPPTATRVSGAAGAGGGGGGGGGLFREEDDPYGLPVESPLILGRRPSDSGRAGGGAGRGAAAAAALGIGIDERTTDSASGPALFTSFGDALPEPSAGGAACGAAAGGGDDFGLFAGDGGAAGGGLGLPAPSSGFRRPAAAPAAGLPALGGGRSRLVKGTSRNDRDEDVDEDDGFGLGAEPGLGGGAGGGAVAAEPPPGGILNASIRSQAAASDRLGASLRSNRYGGGAGAGAGAGAAGTARRVGDAESSSGSLGGGGRGGAGARPGAAAAGGIGFDPYGLDGELGGGGGGGGGLGGGLPPPTLARSPAASGRKGAARDDDGDGDGGLLDYDENDLLGGDEEIDHGLGGGDGDGDDF